MTPREELLTEAIKITTGDRNEQYGRAYYVMKRHTDILNTLGYRFDERLLEPHDNAVILIALKLARLVGNPQYKDSWADTAGYAAIGWEAAVVHQDRDTPSPYTEENLCAPAPAERYAEMTSTARQAGLHLAKEADRALQHIDDPHMRGAVNALIEFVIGQVS